eukprot:2548762-Karenia_brevis.AAC.1
MKPVLEFAMIEVFGTPASTSFCQADATLSFLSLSASPRGGRLGRTNKFPGRPDWRLMDTNSRMDSAESNSMMTPVLGLRGARTE